MLDILLDKIILNYKFIFIYYDIKKMAKKLMSQTACQAKRIMVHRNAY